MEKAETIDDVLSKKGSIAYVWEIIDPENKYAYSTAIKEWYRLSLLQQRRGFPQLLRSANDGRLCHSVISLGLSHSLI